MTHYVLDSYALLAYAEKEIGCDEVGEILKMSLDGRARIFLSVINWGEMYYIALREGGKVTAEEYRTTFASYPITVVDADQELTLHAAYFKAFNKFSYADAFAAALTLMKDGVLVTGDPEFKPLEGKIKLKWLG